MIQGCVTISVVQMLLKGMTELIIPSTGCFRRVMMTRLKADYTVAIKTILDKRSDK
jgi:hypothetical protein